MNKNILWVLALGILVLLGYMFFSAKDKAIDAPKDDNTTTPPVTNNNPPAQNQAGVPVVVTDAKATPSESTVVLTGKVTPNGAFTTYWYEYGTSANLGSKTTSQSIGSGYMGIPAPAYITGLSASTNYYFRLVAENQYGKVSGVQYSFQTQSMGNPPPVGTAPTTKSIAASAITRNTANLNGEVTPGGADTQHWFEYGKTANLGNASPLQSAGSGNSKLPVSISLSDLEAGTTYYFRLNAQNKFGTVNGSILNFKTTAPAAAVAPKVSIKPANKVESTSATLRGSVNPGEAATSYWFEYSTDSLLGSVLVEATDSKSVGAGTESVDVEADISALNSNTTYYFRLVARNSVGTVMSEKTSFKTK